MTTETPAFDEWAVIELMGHRKLAGRVTEQQIAGAGFLRLDVPGDDTNAAVTQLYAPSAVYAIHPTSEAIARHVASQWRYQPVSRWELAAAAPAKTDDDAEDYDEDGGPF